VSSPNAITVVEEYEISVVSPTLTQYDIINDNYIISYYYIM